MIDSIKALALALVAAALAHPYAVGYAAAHVINGLVPTKLHGIPVVGRLFALLDQVTAITPPDRVGTFEVPPILRTLQRAARGVLDAVRGRPPSDGDPPTGTRPVGLASVAMVALLLALGACTHTWQQNARAGVVGAAYGLRAWDTAAAAALREEGAAASAAEYPAIDRRYAAQLDGIRAVHLVLRQAEHALDEADAGRLDPCSVPDILATVSGSVQEILATAGREGRITIPQEVGIATSVLDAALGQLRSLCAARGGAR